MKTLVFKTRQSALRAKRALVGRNDIKVYHVGHKVLIKKI